ncbi:MAG: branched-chain amino acid ABC transporter permease [Candidatus Dormibacteraeota bacterium]|nr:branched-chain amino acid ABC transporter permease [Candidatus Dormibacteraeota bacterium]
MLELASNPGLEFVQQVVSGIAAGGVYASVALALVLIYRAMDVANFAQGEMAMFSTFIAYTLITAFHLPFLVVFPTTIAIAFAGGVLIERVMIRPFEGKPILTLVIVTLALFSLTNGLAGLIWGYILQDFPSPFPAEPIVIGGIYIGQQDLGILAVCLVILSIVYVFFRFTKVGLAMRAAALYPESSKLVGVRVSWMLALGWGLASAIGATAGMMIAPITFLDPNFMQPILLFAFAAAVLGGIESPLGAVLGGLLVGILLALVGTYLPAGQNLRIPFALVVIVAVLLIRPAGLIGRAAVTRV